MKKIGDMFITTVEGLRLIKLTKASICLCFCLMTAKFEFHSTTRLICPKVVTLEIGYSDCHRPAKFKASSLRTKSYFESIATS